MRRHDLREYVSTVATRTDVVNMESYTRFTGCELGKINWKHKRKENGMSVDGVVCVVGHTRVGKARQRLGCRQPSVGKNTSVT